MDEMEKFTKERNFPPETATNIEFVFSDSGVVKAKITAPLAEFYQGEQDYTEMPKGLQAVFFDLKLNPNAYLYANYGKRITSDRLIELRDSVVVVNLNGDTLNTEELFWNERKDIVYSNRFVRVKTKDQIIFSEGFESDPTFSYYKFYKIKGTISLED